MPAAATDAIVRCQAPDGSIGYTDRSCAVFGAESIAVDRYASGDLGDPSDAFNAPGQRAPMSGCARTPTQLAMDVHAAIAMDDVNRLAASYHFAGMSSSAGERTLDRLQSLVGRSVIASEYFDASIASTSIAGFGEADGMVAGPVAQAGRGTLQVVLGADDSASPGRAPAVIAFEVRRYAGCYFMRF